MKKLDNPIVANPGNPSDGLLKLQFSNWKNPATTKLLDGFDLDVADKVDFLTSYGVLDSRWSLAQKFQSITFYQTHAKEQLADSPTSESFFLIKANVLGATNSEFKFKIKSQS